MAIATEQDRDEQREARMRTPHAEGEKEPMNRGREKGERHCTTLLVADRVLFLLQVLHLYSSIITLCPFFPFSLANLWGILELTTKQCMSKKLE